MFGKIGSSFIPNLKKNVITDSIDKIKNLKNPLHRSENGESNQTLFWNFTSIS
jgi:hypothetical protein